jgi:hypothetical protein
MSSKREERKQRAEAHREEFERDRRRRIWRSRAVAVGVLLTLIVAGYLTTRRRDGEESNGRVWSAAHGHWHDK